MYFKQGNIKLVYKTHFANLRINVALWHGFLSLGFISMCYTSGVVLIGLAVINHNKRLQIVLGWFKTPLIFNHQALYPYHVLSIAVFKTSKTSVYVKEYYKSNFEHLFSSMDFRRGQSPDNFKELTVCEPAFLKVKPYIKTFDLIFHNSIFLLV